MKKRLFWKFFAGYFLLSVFLTLTFYLLVVDQARQFHRQAKEEALAQLGGLVGAELAPFWPGPDEAALDRFIKEKGRQAQARFTVIDLRGRVMADSQKEPAAMQNHSDRPEIAAAISGRSSSETHFSFTLRENMMYHALPLRSGDKTVAVLRSSLFVRELDQVFIPWRGQVTILLLALLGLSLFLSALLSRNLARPVRELAGAARRFAAGSTNSHVYSRRRDEIGQLAADFNAMVDSQNRALAELRYGRQELETILGALSDGLLVLDAGERVTRAGPRFCQLVGDAQPLGKPYWEVLRAKEFAELLQKAAARSARGEVEIDGKAFLASLSPLPDNGGTVITFHDLSESRRLEKQKKDFVANVSHELRTPLTAIKGYAETMADDTTGEARKYLDVILRHTDRLIELTNDLLSLSALEEKGSAPGREAVDWSELLSSVRDLFEKKLRAKNLRLEIALAEDPAAIAFKGDRFRLEELFVNLLDNAVRYTEQGGITVRVAPDDGPAGPGQGDAEGHRRRGRGILIEVSDSGVGIAPEHLPRIFERFYVVDKARSRQSGGTGLGLAIVKHIVQLHRGEIEARSVPGAGSTFSIRLPLD